MMDQDRWNKLKETFSNDELFKERKWIDDYEIDDVDLQEWLECDSRSPSGRMIHQFSLHGYKVYPGEKDSFGWLSGVVMDKASGREITFG